MFGCFFLFTTIQVVILITRIVNCSVHLPVFFNLKSFICELCYLNSKNLEYLSLSGAINDSQFGKFLKNINTIAALFLELQLI